MDSIKVHKTITSAYNSGVRASRYARLLKEPINKQKYKPILVDNPLDKYEARRLHAATYLKKGFIDSWEVSESGVIHDEYDPHHNNARYFVVKESAKIISTARQITISHSKDYSDLPLYKNAILFEGAREEIHKTHPKKVIEISGLAKRDGTSPYAVLAMYRKMWQYSYHAGDELWLMACSPALYQRLKFLFGDTILAIGHQTPYKGEAIVPAALNVKKSVAHLRNPKPILNPFKYPLQRYLTDFLFEDFE